MPNKAIFTKKKYIINSIKIFTRALFDLKKIKLSFHLKILSEKKINNFTRKNIKLTPHFQ